MTIRTALTAVVLVAVALLASACFGGGPVATVKAFYERVEQGELDEAVELFSTTLRSQIGDDKLKQGLQSATREIDQKGGVAKMKILEENIIGEVADVEVEITYGDGSSETTKMSLIKEDGRWRLQAEDK